MTLSKSTPHMTKSIMPLFELFGIGTITCCLENLLFTLIMKLWCYLHSQKKLNFRHGNWVEFLQRYYFVVKHRAGVKNKAADALSRRVSLLSIMSVKVTGFERLKDDYESCPNFGELYTSLSNAPWPILDDYTLQDGYLFKANKLYIPRSSVRDFLIWEIHAGSLAGHFGTNKRKSKKKMAQPMALWMKLISYWA